MRSVLITRPQPVADEFAERLRREGFYAYLAPMTEYVEIDAPPPEDMGSYQALIFTSAQAAQIFSGRPSVRLLPVLAVGDATAAAARKAGFTTVYSAKGDGGDMAGLIESVASALALKKVLHPCGEDMADDIGPDVSGRGVKVVRMPVYKARFLNRLPEDVAQALQRGVVDVVTVFSARAAENLVKMLQQDDMRGVSAKLEAVCISRRAAAGLRGIPWRAIRVARHPATEEMVEILKGREPGLTSPSLLSGNHVIAAFGGIRPLASRMGITASIVQGWKKRGFIPELRTEAVLAAAKEGGIDTDGLWQEEDGKMKKEDHTDVSTRDRRETPDRRRQQAIRDERGFIRSPSYTGPDRRSGIDRRAYRKRQQARILAEKMNFMHRSALTFAFMFFAIVVAGVFIMAPEYAHLLDMAKWEDLVKERMKLLPREKEPESPKTSIGGTMNRGIERMRGVTGPLSDLAGAAAGAIGNSTLPDFMKVLENVNALRRTEGGEEAVTQSLNTLRTLLAATPDKPEEINASIEAARRRDRTLNSLLGSVRGKDLAAAAMLLTLNEFRSNVNRNRPYENDLALLQKFVGNDPGMNRSLRRLAPYAEKGVMSREALQTEFGGLATDIVTAKLRGQDVSVQERALRRFDRLSRAGRADDIKGGNTEAVTARAQLLLDQGDVKGAMQELRALEGAPAQAAEPWMDNAAGYVIADQSSDDLTQSLLQGVMGNTGFSVPTLFTEIKENVLHMPYVPYVSSSFKEGSANSSGALAPASSMPSP
ncbi:MAG: uroporphyrinogen-III synthase [Pseudomonadota bacterium]